MIVIFELLEDMKLLLKLRYISLSKKVTLTDIGSSVYALLPFFVYPQRLIDRPWHHGNHEFSECITQVISRVLVQ